MLPEGYTLTIYKDAIVSGDSMVFHGKEDEYGRQVCQDVPDEMHDNVSSFTITKDTASAKGDWQLIASNTLDVTFEWGFSKSNTDTQSEELEKHFSSEMSFGGIEHLDKKMSRDMTKKTTKTV